MSWHDKVKKAMAKRSKEAWAQAGNKAGNGHKPYSLPEIVVAMRDALNADDEHEGKRLLMLDRSGSLSLV